MHAPQQSDVEPEAVQAWAHERDDLMQRIGQYFARRKARERTHEYVRALLSPVERKSAWQVAEMAGDCTPYGVQNLLGRAAWDADTVRDELCVYATEHLGDPDGVLVIDETCFPKKGAKSVGVARQYYGSLGQGRKLPLLASPRSTTTVILHSKGSGHVQVRTPLAMRSIPGQELALC